MTDIIDIQVRDAGTPVVVRNLTQVGSAANAAAVNVNLLNKALSMTGQTDPGFMKIAKAASSAQAQVNKLSAQVTQQAAAATTQANSVATATKAVKAHTQAQAASVVAAGQASKAYSGTAKTAREIQFATRGLPAQFTDIAVSLQGGQRPLNVLLQQGGQLKDMFGGIGPAARAMGTYILGLLNPILLVSVALGALAILWYKGSQEMNRFNSALAATGNYADMTADKAARLADEMDNLAGVTARSAMNAMVEVAASGAFAGEQFEIVTKTAEIMRVRTGVAIEDTIAKFREFGDDPVQALLKLNKTEHFLTQTHLDRIDALIRVGDHQGAVTEAMRIYAEVVDSRSKEIVQNLGAIEFMWKGIKKIGAEAIDSLMALGRADTIASVMDKQAKTQGRLNLLKVTGLGWTLQAKAAEEKLLKLAKQREALMAAAAKTETPKSEEKVLDTRQVEEQRKAALAFASQGVQYLSDEQKMRHEIAEMEKLGATAKIGSLEIDKRRNAIMKEYADRAAKAAALLAKKGKGAEDKEARELERLANALESVRGQVSPVESALKRLRDAEDVLNQSVAKGLIDQKESVRIMGLLADRFHDQIHPLQAMREEMDRYYETLKLSNKEARIQEELYSRTEALKKRGAILTQAETEALRDKIAATQQAERIARMRDGYEEGGSTGQKEVFMEQLQGFKDAIAGAKMVEGDTAAFMQGMLPWADVTGTSEQMAAYVQMHADMYAQVDALLEANVIKHETAERLKAQADAQYNAQRLRGASAFFGTLGSLSSSSNRELAAIGKAAAITQATIDGVVAVQKAYTSVPYPYNIPAAIAQGVVAASNVASIMSTPLPGFRTGGNMVVGGSGGDDSQLVAFRATPGERVTVNTPAQARAQENQGSNEVNVPVTVVNVEDPQRYVDAMDTAAGGRVILNHINSDPAAFKRALGMN